MTVSMGSYLGIQISRSPPFCGAVWMIFIRLALEFTRLETAEGGGSKSFSSMLASLTKIQEVPSSTILLSTFRVIILATNTQTLNWKTETPDNLDLMGGKEYLPQIKEQHTHKGERTLDLHWAAHDSDQLENTTVNSDITMWTVSAETPM